MNVDHILETLNGHQVAYILIGGMNFLLRHTPVLTYDVDLWIDDTPANLDRCEKALGELQAEWGATDNDWGSVSNKTPGWLGSQAVFCLTSPHGAVDIFLSVTGLKSWAESRAKAKTESTANGVEFIGLSDDDMLKSQMALSKEERNEQRIRVLKQSVDLTEHGRQN